MWLRPSDNARRRGPLLLASMVLLMHELNVHFIPTTTKSIDEDKFTRMETKPALNFSTSMIDNTTATNTRPMPHTSMGVSTNTNRNTIKYESPLIVLTEGGCSGTTSVGRTIRQIINQHGFTKTKGVTFEFLNAIQYNPRSHTYKNKFFHDIVTERNLTTEKQIRGEYKDILIESILRAQKMAMETKSLLFFKANIEQFMDLQSWLLEEESFLKGNVSYVGVYRENLLDRCICMVRDCFDEALDYGTPVYGANGTETNLCFNRRHHPEVDVKANFFDVQGCLEEDQKRVDFIKRKKFHTSSSDVLFQFENTMDDEIFETSINAWMNVLQPLLRDSLEMQIVARVLEEGRGKRMETHSSQESKVYKYHKLKEELSGIRQWKGLLHD